MTPPLAHLHAHTPTTGADIKLWLLAFPPLAARRLVRFCVCVFGCVCSCVCVHVCVRVCVCVCVCVCACACVATCISTACGATACAFLCVHVCVCLCALVCVRVHACVRVRVPVWLLVFPLLAVQRLGFSPQFVTVCCSDLLHLLTSSCCYGVATISRLLQIIGLFCRILSVYRSVLQTRPIILRSLLVAATPT